MILLASSPDNRLRQQIGRWLPVRLNTQRGSYWVIATIGIEVKETNKRKTLHALHESVRHITNIWSSTEASHRDPIDDHHPGKKPNIKNVEVCSFAHVHLNSTVSLSSLLEPSLFKEKELNERSDGRDVGVMVWTAATCERKEALPLSLGRMCCLLRS